MEEERGMAYKMQLDQESQEFDSLHTIFKKLVKSEESTATSRNSFRQKWLEVSNIERHPSLSKAFMEYAKALHEIDKVHKESILRLKTVVQDALHYYPLRIKQQQRSLSRSSKASKALLERKKTIAKLQEKGDSREIDNEKLTKAATELKEKQKEAQEITDQFERSMQEYSKNHSQDLRSILAHLINSEMHYHAGALNALSQVIPVVLKIDPDKERSLIRPKKLGSV